MTIGTDLPLNLSTPLNDHERRLGAIEQPKSPLRVYASAATTAAELGDPAKYRLCLVLLTALNTLAWSDGTDWIRQDTQGAL